MGMEERIWYSSFNHYSLKKVKECNPSARTGILYSDGWIEPWNYAKELGVDAMHPFFVNTQYPGYLENCKRLGLKTHAWTVNEKEYMQLLSRQGIEALITNYPDIARKVVEE